MKNTENKEPEPGQVYLHHSGKPCMILGIASVDFGGFANDVEDYLQLWLSFDPNNPEERTWIVADPITGELFYSGWVVQSPANQRFVIYACSGKVWHRELNEFMDGRFTLINVLED